MTTTAERTCAPPHRLRGLCCPSCRGRLAFDEADAECLGCGKRYPVDAGRPALLDPERSPFAQPDAAAAHEGGRSRWSAAAARLPRLSANPRTAQKIHRFLELACATTPRPRLLSIGCGEGGEGMRAALEDPRAEWLETDVRWTSRTALLSDVHQLPFEDQSFDGVVLQAVLEHVLDPQQAVREALRVLRPGGAVYAETPFLQHVHAGAHDFTRYTHLGHRRLFRDFCEVDSGVAAGPGVALAWAWQGFLLAWCRTPAGRRAATTAARLSAFWLKYLDSRLLDAPGAFDCASAYYFLGYKAREALPDDELLREYRGLQS